MQLIKMRLDKMTPAPYNPRSIDEQARQGLANSLARFGMAGVIVWNKRTGNVVGGHQRRQALIEAGVEEAIVSVVDLDIESEKALNMSLNNPNIRGEWSENASDLIEHVMREDKDLADALRFAELEESLGKASKEKIKKEPEFEKGLLDSRQPEWREKRERWNDKLIKETHDVSGVDAFDPVLMDFLLETYTNQEDCVLDLFCGNTDKAKVCAEKGRKYVGVDLSHERIEANKNAMGEATWVEGDALEFNEDFSPELVILNVPLFDFIKYSTSEKDLSNMKEKEYLNALEKAIKKSHDLTKSTMMTVISDTTDEEGKCFPLVDSFKEIAKKIGFSLIDERVYVFAGGILPGIVRKEFGVRRMYPNCQNVLVFKK